jgi:ABC-type xylose transport system substrate-binding protein
LTSLEKDGSMDLITHMTDSDKLDFIGELWNDFWLEKV